MKEINVGIDDHWGNRPQNHPTSRASGGDVCGSVVKLKCVNWDGFVKSALTFEQGAHTFCWFTLGVRFGDKVKDYFVKVWGNGATQAYRHYKNGYLRKGQWVVIPRGSLHEKRDVTGFVKYEEIHCAFIRWDVKGGDKC